MSVTSSVLSIIFLACIMHTFIKRRQSFQYKWDLLRYYLFAGMPAYLIFCDIHYALKSSIALVMSTMVIRKLLFTDKRFSLLLNLINVMAIIVAVNVLKQADDVTPMSYVGLSYCFGAFFMSFFDSVLLFKENFKIRPLFLGLGYLFMFHIIWSVLEVGL